MLLLATFIFPKVEHLRNFPSLRGKSRVPSKHMSHTKHITPEVKAAPQMEKTTISVLFTRMMFEWHIWKLLLQPELMLIILTGLQKENRLNRWIFNQTQSKCSITKVWTCFKHQVVSWSDTGVRVQVSRGNYRVVLEQNMDLKTWSTEKFTSCGPCFPLKKNMHVQSKSIYLKKPNWCANKQNMMSCRHKL